MANPVVKKSDLDLALARAKSNPGDYTALTNKPSINNVTLVGNKTAADLGLVQAVNGKGLSTNDYTTAEKNKLAGIEAGAEVNVIDGITFNGNPVTVTNKIAAIQSTGNVQDVQINKSSIVSNGVANIPYAGEDQFGVIAIDVANDPGSKYVKISYDDPSHPAGQASHSQDVYLPLMPSANSPFPYWYLPDATYTQKGAVTLNEWVGTITDNYDEYGNEGYDSTLDGYVRTVTTTNGHFTLTSGNKIRIDNVHFSGYHKHFLNVDGTGAIELLFAPNYSVYTGDIGAIVSGSIDILYNGTNYLIVNGFAYKRPTTPQASTNQFGTVKVDWRYEASSKYVEIATSNGYIYVPLLEKDNSSSVPSGKIGDRYLPDLPDASSSNAGVVKVVPVTEPPTGYYFIKDSNNNVLACVPMLEYSNGAYQPIRARWIPDATSSVKGAVIVDNAMSDSSTNPVQNSVVKAYIDSHSGNPSASNVSFDDTNCSVIQAQEVQTAIEGLDFYLNDTMGRTLPSVTASDNGKVLAVVNGAWAKSSSSGGVSDVTVNGTSVVSNNVAAVIVPTEAADISFDDSNCNVIQARDCQEGIEGLDYQLDFLGGLFNTRVPVLQANGTFCLTATKAQGGNPSYAWGNAKGVSAITSGGTDAVNSVAVIDYINSLDATNTSY